MSDTRKSPPWAERIPQAIAKAELHHGNNDCLFYCEHGYPSPGEVALAKALWGWEQNYRYIRQDQPVAQERGQFDPALRAFVEKVEAL